MENTKNNDKKKDHNVGAGIIDEEVRKNKQKIHGGDKKELDDNEIENTDQKGFEKANLD